MSTQELCVHTADDYERFVTRLASKDSMAGFNAKLGTLGLGLAGEAGEIAKIASSLRQGGELSDEVRDHLLDEAGDLCWYAAFGAANVLQIPFQSYFGDFDEELPGTPIEQLYQIQCHLSEDCGGVADLAKKVLFHGKPYSVEVQAKIKQHIGGVLQSVVYIAVGVCSTGYGAVIDRNVKKLSERYKSLEFTTEEFLAKERGERS